MRFLIGGLRAVGVLGLGAAYVVGLVLLKHWQPWIVTVLGILSVLFLFVSLMVALTPARKP